MGFGEQPLTSVALLMSAPLISVEFDNDEGVAEIEISVRQFRCMGATPPHGHPLITLDMGQRDTISCPYCATRFTFKLLPGATNAAFNAAVSEGWHTSA